MTCGLNATSSDDLDEKKRIGSADWGDAESAGVEGDDRCDQSE